MKEFKKNLKRVWVFIKPLKVRFVFNIIISIMMIIMSIVFPILSAQIIVNLTNSEFIQLIAISLIICILNFIDDLLYYFQRKNYQIIFRESYLNIQNTIGREILKLENQVIDNNGTGVFIQRITGDASKLSDIFNFLINNLKAIITNVGIFCAIFIVNKLAFVFLLLQTIIIYFVERESSIKRNDADKKFREKNEKVTSFVSELVRGSRDIKMLNAENSFMEELANKNREANELRYKMGSIGRKYDLATSSIYNISSFLFIALLVYLISKDTLNIATALVLYNYSERVCNINYYIQNILEQIKNFNLSANRVFNILDSIEFKKEKFGNKKITNIHGNFEFKNVSFSYKKDEVLKDINFKIKAGETVAFVGKSGAGKTTIFNLLCKMYRVKNNHIFIDGIDINKLDKDSIRGNITIISQNPYIFNLSIRENLSLVKENLTEEDMIDACKTACLHDYIMSLRDGYDTIIGEGGINLSGGQKQRLAIARALVQKTKIILFDEATSALDNETQSKIQEAIENMKGEYTILIIAHRLSTIINSDRILFLNEGKIEASGTHDELIANNDNYKKLYNSEINKK